jgi:hypothetical protein
MRAEGPVEHSLGRKPQVVDENTDPMSPEGAAESPGARKPSNAIPSSPPGRLVVSSPHMGR